MAEERREEDGDGSDRTRKPGGGEGERVRMESSDSQSEGGSVSGELDPPVNMKGAIVKGRRRVCVFVAGVSVVDASGSSSRGVVQREPRPNNVQRTASAQGYRGKRCEFRRHTRQQ